MTQADLPLIAFAVCNALRISAFFPQMILLACRPGTAASFSHATWVLFLAANLSTAVYAFVVLSDTVLGIVHAISALCCGVLIGLALWRCRFPVVAHAAEPR
jgi:hypothetical protein